MNQEMNYGGLTPLTEREAIEMQGGIFWLIPPLVAGLIISALANIQDIRDGLADGWNGTPRYGTEEATDKCQ